MFLRLLCIFLLCTSSYAASISSPDDSTIIKTEYGLIAGEQQKAVIRFLGIPYAAPPVGQLRWQAPLPPLSWKHILLAKQFAPDCMQEPMPGDAAQNRSGFSEDCLYLNIWRPANLHRHALPVMVWIHGGGFVNGGSSPAIYSGQEFAKRGVVLVSFNYRLGRFGFFAHPALTDSQKNSITGNYAYMDMLAALGWIRRNIPAFGGDPNNVTFFGESAGGFAIHTLMVSPLAKGLFQKAIIQSGGGRIDDEDKRCLSEPSEDGLDSAESIGIAFAKRYGIIGTSAKALSALRALPASELAKGLNMNSDDPTFSGPMIDGKLVINNPAHLYEIGTGIDIPLIVGANDMDIGISPQVNTMQDALAPLGPESFQRAVQVYDPERKFAPQDVADILASDQMMVEPARFTAKMAAAQGQPVYTYRFAYVADCMKKVWLGAPHASEIPYVFNTLQARSTHTATANDKAMSAQIQQYWVNFAKTGNPNADGLPRWPRYDAEHDQIMLFSAAGAQATHALADPWKARLDLVEKIANK